MNPIRSLTNSSAEACSITLAEFDKAREVHGNDLRDNELAWRRYFPVDMGKWSKDDLKMYREDHNGMDPPQIDIASPRIDTLVGSIISDLPDPSWIPVKGERSILTEAIALKYYTDKDLYNYDDVFLKVLRGGLIHSGDMIITEDWRYDEPAVKFESVQYGYNILWDPTWQTDNDRDAEIYWRIAYLNPIRLKNKYQFVYPEIEQAIKDYQKDKSKYSTNPYVDKKDLSQGKVGDEFQVIEKHYLKEIRTKRLIGRRYDDNYWIPFPINKDREYLSMFADVNGIDWDTVEETVYNDRIEYVTTAVRQLNLCIQEDVKGKVQVNGLSAHHFSARMHMGRNMGIMNSIADIEDMVIKHETLARERAALAANGGIMNENLFPDPKKWDDFQKDKNRVGKYTKAPLDDVQKVMEHIIDNPGNFDLEKQIQRALHEYLPLVSRVSEALSSMSDSNEPGILFERKFQTNMIANTVLNKNIRQFLNNVAESYFYQYQITYGELQIPVNERGGNKIAIVLNQRKGEKVYNAVKDTPRCRVVMAENTKSATYQMRWRSIWAEMTTALAGTVQATGGTTIPYLLLTIKNLFDTIEVKEEDKSTREVIDDMVMMIARLKLVAEASTNQTKIGNDTLMNAQIDMQLQQILQQTNAMQQQLPPVSMEPIESRNVQYNINPQQTTEAAQSEATPPAGPELAQSGNPAESIERILK